MRFLVARHLDPGADGTTARGGPGDGVSGIFVGPVVLAVTHTLLDEWIAEGGHPPAVDAGSRIAPIPVEPVPATNGTMGIAK